MMAYRIPEEDVQRRLREIEQFGDDAALGRFVRERAKDQGPAGVVPRNLIRTFRRERKRDVGP